MKRIARAFLLFSVLIALSGVPRVSSQADAPHIAVVDRTGKVVYTGLGGDQDVEAALKKAL